MSGGWEWRKGEGSKKEIGYPDEARIKAQLIVSASKAEQNGHNNSDH